MNIGERDLGLGRARLVELAKAAPFPLLSANLVDVASGEEVLKPFALIERAGLRLGVLGLLSDRRAAPYAEALGRDGLRVAPPGDALAALKARLDEARADAWIVLSQLTPAEEDAIAAAEPRIRAFLGGDTMVASPDPSPVEGAWRFGAGQKGKQVSLFTVDFQAPGGPGVPWSLGDPKGLAERRRAAAAARIKQLDAQLQRLVPAPPAGEEAPVGAPPGAPNPRLTEVRRNQLEAQLAQARGELKAAEAALAAAEALGDDPGNSLTFRVFQMGKDLADDPAEAEAVKAFRLKWPAPPGH